MIMKMTSSTTPLKQYCSLSSSSSPLLPHSSSSSNKNKILTSNRRTITSSFNRRMRRSKLTSGSYSSIMFLFLLIILMIMSELRHVNAIGEVDSGEFLFNSNSNSNEMLLPHQQKGKGALNNENLSNEEEDSITIYRQPNPQVLARLESKFLSILGMKERPSLDKKKKIQVPKHLIDLYERQSGQEFPTSNLDLPGRNTRTANTVRSFYPRDDDNPHEFLKFTLETIPTEEEVTGAEIRVPFIFRKNEEGAVPRGKLRVLLHDVIRPRSSLLNEDLTQVIDSKRINPSKFTKNETVFYLTFDAYPAVGRWRNTKGKGRGLLMVEIQELEDNEDQGPKGKLRVKRDLKSRRKREAEVGGDKEIGSTSPTSTPITLFTYSDDGHTHRKTRDAKTLSRVYRAAQQGRKRNRQRNKNRKRNLCARHPMFVDFTDVGWNDWIVAPPGYQAHHCSGECPFPMAEHLNATNHAVIQALVNSVNPGLVPPPCCVPTKYSALSLLYTDSNEKIVLKVYNEMVVEGCGCN